jgi:hypothetical protein
VKVAQHQCWVAFKNDRPVRAERYNRTLLSRRFTVIKDSRFQSHVALNVRSSLTGRNLIHRFIPSNKLLRYYFHSVLADALTRFFLVVEPELRPDKLRHRWNQRDY